MLYGFGHFQADTVQRVLTRDGAIVPLPPKVFDLLVVLLASPGEVVPREELLSRVWPEAAVEEANIAKSIHLLRKLLGEYAIETFPKRGYRFVLEVTEVRLPGRAPVPNLRWIVACTAVLLFVFGIGASAVYFKTRHAGIRSIAVLPFQTPDPVDRLLALGFTQELTARLTTLGDLRVISGAGPDPQVEAVLTGSFHASAGGLKVSAQLVNVKDRSVIWSGDVDPGPAKDLYSTEHVLAAAIAARLRGRVNRGARARLENGGSTSTEAYAAYLRGRAEAMHTQEDRSASARARTYFARAVELDPGFANAWGWLAFMEHEDYTNGGGSHDQRELALEHAQRALSIDPNNAIAHRAVTYIYSIAGDNERALREAKTALDANPADPDAALAAARAYFRASMLDRAINLYERYLATYPDDDAVRGDLLHACVFADAYERGLRDGAAAVNIQRLIYPTFLLYANSGDYAHAVPLARRTLASPSAAVFAQYFASIVLRGAGLEAEARQTWIASATRIQERLDGRDNERSRVWLALIYAQLEQWEDAREQIRRAELLNPEGDSWMLFFESETYALLGDRSAALDALRKAIYRGFLGLHYLTYYQKPLYGWHRYRTDPEFQAIAHGLAERVADLRKRF